MLLFDVGQDDAVPLRCTESFHGSSNHAAHGGNFPPSVHGASSKSLAS